MTHSCMVACANRGTGCTTSAASLRQRFTTCTGGIDVSDLLFDSALSCTCRRAVQATRQVTYSLKAAGEKGKRSRLAKGAAAGREQCDLCTVESLEAGNAPIRCQSGVCAPQACLPGVTMALLQPCMMSSAIDEMKVS